MDASLLLLVAGVIGGATLPKFWDMTVDKFCKKFAPDWANCDYCGYAFAFICFALLSIGVVI